MNINIKHILQQGEGVSVEFKTTFNTDAIESLVAFANTKGGVVCIGITDEGTIKGVTLGKESLQQWTNDIKNRTEPSLIPDVDEVEIDGKKVALFRAEEYPIKPISVQGRYYKRVGNSNHLMSVAEVSDYYLKSMQYSWDAYTRPDKSLDDLDEHLIERFLNRINKKGRLKLAGNNLDKLRKLNLIKDNIPTNAAVLLFAKEPLMYDVHAGRLKTPDKILDNIIIRNTLFETVEETMNYIIGHLKVAYEITSETVRKSTQRVEIFEYPLDAIRELVLNAIIHRKYSSPIDIQIKIFDKKITFFNPGELYGNITVDDLNRDDYQASARNKLIVEAFYLAGDIEKYGTGYQRIRKAIEDYPTMIFTCRETQGGFLVELKYDKQKEFSEDVTKIEDVTDDVTNNVTKVDDVTDDVTNDVTKIDDVTGCLRQQTIIEIIQINPKISTTTLARKLNVTRMTLYRDLAKLKTNGLIEKKNRYWKVTESNDTSKTSNSFLDRVPNKVTDEVTDRVTDEVTNKVTDRVTNKVTDRVTNKVTDNQRTILDLIKNNKNISTNEISIIIGISKRKILQNISKLKEMKLIERVGNNKNGHWKIIKSKTMK